MINVIRTFEFEGTHYEIVQDEHAADIGLGQDLAVKEITVWVQSNGIPANKFRFSVKPSSAPDFGKSDCDPIERLMGLAQLVVENRDPAAIQNHLP